MSGIPYVATLVTALACGVVAGVFFAFSTFVMAALKRLPPRQGIAAMQSINVTVITPLFMLTLFGAALACLGLGGWALFASGDHPTALLLAGAACYLIGTIVVTMTGNVPMNNRLMELDADDPTSADYWDEYVTRWTNLNHIRTLAPLAAAALFTLALAS